MSRQATLWILCLVVLTGVGLRSYELTARSLWFDEAFSWRLVQFPFDEMLDRAAADVHPPLYYVLLRGWTTVFGQSLVALRSFSVVLAASTILLAYGFVRYAAASRRAGLLAAAMMATSGWLISFAWEARMYTLGMALAILSSWLVLRGIRRPTIPIWLLYGLAAAAFAYTHYFAFFTLAAQLIFVAGVVVKQTRWRIGEIFQLNLFWFAVSGILLTVALYIPWIPVVLQQNSQVQQAYWVPPIGGWSIPDTFYRIVLPTPGIPTHIGWPLVITALPIMGTMLMWLLLLIAPRQRDASVFIMLLGFLPFVCTIFISFVGQSLYQDRFLVFASLFILIGIAFLVEFLSRRWANILAIILPLLLLASFVRYWFILDIPDKPGAGAAVAHIAQQRVENEPVIVSSPFVFFAVDHYLEESYGQPGVAKLYSPTGELLHFAGGPILRQEDLIMPNIFTNPAYTTLWVVDTTGFGGEKLSPPAPWRVVEEVSYLEVFDYQKEVFVRKLVR